MSRWIRLVRRFLGCNWSDQKLLLAVLFLLGITRCLLLTVPFRRISPYFGEHMVESPQEDPGQRWYILRVGRAIETVSRHTPWESKCLVQAITAKLLLRRYRLHNTLYLGVAKDTENKMIAHAWLRVGGVNVTGGSNIAGYTVVSTFADV